jgi:hypothetical protein
MASSLPIFQLSKKNSQTGILTYGVNSKTVPLLPTPP